MTNFLDSVQIRKSNMKSSFLALLILTLYQEVQICLVSMVLSHGFREKCIPNVKSWPAPYLTPVLFKKAMW